jgi:hypothetical protein
MKPMVRKPSPSRIGVTILFFPSVEKEFFLEAPFGDRGRFDFRSPLLYSEPKVIRRDIVDQWIRLKADGLWSLSKGCAQLPQSGIFPEPSGCISP